MFKSNHGVTLTVLVVTIIIMLILAAVTMSININTNKSVELKELVVNMELIKTSAQGFSDRYLGTEEEDKLPGFTPTYINTLMGTLIGTTQEEDVPAQISQYWRQLDADAFKEMGIDIKLDGEEAYFVDYASMDVAYVKSTIPVNGTYPGIVTKNSKSSVPGSGGSGSVINGEKVVYFYDQIKNLKADDVAN